MKLFIFGFIAGAAIAWVVHIFVTKPHYDGSFVVNTTDPKKDIYRLELETLDDIWKKDKIVLKVTSHEKHTL